MLYGRHIARRRYQDSTSAGVYTMEGHQHHLINVKTKPAVIPYVWSCVK